ncbi:uncharacterized protein B0J16DRAFT_375931 [Fusarium flagelliforme]|uniref:Uncharacterized protein n=1 Tax=Fusarium flagelliforme TaxID=2675880 RepID=A0A395MS78_9HYPO|nr:uncharacterized protein B0J16DRAFT_375931 [Fusarium flagelliforme]KAH7173271.1 hypothetical protein B0J16DRAFT_375931 [Fusarium flagelliforme]RFN50776.1 hypothetical protein FIE12Z_5014 [Fusarium flagelliforme]
MLKDTFVSTAVYNSLPHISEVFEVPKTHASDLTDLRALLFKHGVPSSVSIRLIHKHFTVNHDEVMAFKRVCAAPFDEVVVMRPEQISLDRPLHGLNYFVDSGGMLQAYEYTTDETVDMKPYSSFLTEFCAVITQKGLQAKFGLKLSAKEDMIAATEFEYPHLRSTIIIPEGLPKPEIFENEGVVTEWKGIASGDPKKVLCIMHYQTCNQHTKCQSHNGRGAGEEAGEWYFGGQHLVPGSEIYNLVRTVVEVW